MKIGIIHPGSMGAYLGRILSGNHDVFWCSDNRSIATGRRAVEAGFSEIETLAELVNQSDVVFSICPPHAAIEVARKVAAIRAHSFLYVDANTVAPGTTRDIARLFNPSVVVDAALTGAPGSDNLTVWVSGSRRSEVCNLFAGSKVICREVGDSVGQSSAFKICAGLRSKVIPAIWATLIEAAAKSGPEVEFALRAHLEDIGYDLDREVHRVAERAPKAWRWIGEMEESARAMRELGLPTGFSEAASAAYARIAER